MKKPRPTRVEIVQFPILSSVSSLILQKSRFKSNSTSNLYHFHTNNTPDTTFNRHTTTKFHADNTLDMTLEALPYTHVNTQQNEIEERSRMWISRATSALIRLIRCIYGESISTLISTDISFSLEPFCLKPSYPSFPFLWFQI